jgi:hypothetical protein
MATKGSCDNCGKIRYLTHGHACGLETSQCWECTGQPPTCDVCGEELEDGKCTWCFGEPEVDKIRTMLQEMRRENEKQAQELQALTLEER